MTKYRRVYINLKSHYNPLPYFVLIIWFNVSAAYPEGLTYGKWTDVLRFPQSYENGIETDGQRYFACQGQRIKAFDPLRDWWQYRCFDEIREEPRKPRVCNSTAACCYKFCVLQRLEWLSPDLKYDKIKAHAYLRTEYRDHKYPKDIVEDLIDEFDNCADWYEERDTMDCSRNSPFIKCQTQVFINVCDRLPTNVNSIPDPEHMLSRSLQNEPANDLTGIIGMKTTTTTVTPVTKSLKLATQNFNNDVAHASSGHDANKHEYGRELDPTKYAHFPSKNQHLSQSTNAFFAVGRKAPNSHASQHPVTDHSAQQNLFPKCVDKCKGLCLAHTSFSA